MPFSCELSRAANDQSGSDDAAMTRTRTPSQSGAPYGSLMSGGAAPASTTSSTGGGSALSGPVTESKGLRERMESALVAWGLAEAGAGGRRAASGGAARSLSSGPSMAPTTCMIPCASRNADSESRTNTTAQKWRLSSLSIAMARPERLPHGQRCEGHATTQPLDIQNHSGCDRGGRSPAWRRSHRNSRDGDKLSNAIRGPFFVRTSAASVTRSVTRRCRRACGRWSAWRCRAAGRRPTCRRACAGASRGSRGARSPRAAFRSRR